MTRNTFGGTTAEFVATIGAAGQLRVAAATLKFYTARTGGTQVTDLVLNGSPVAAIPVPADGQVPTFQGPDGVTELWADAGGGRVLLRATAEAVAAAAEIAVAARDRAEEAAAAAEAVGTTNDGIVKGLVDDPASGTAGSVAAKIGTQFTDRADVDYVAIFHGFDTTGATDASAALQAAFDASPVVHLAAGSTLLLSGAGVYFDSAAALGSTSGTYILDGRGTATIKLGAGLPAIAAYTPDPACKWALHVNTERTALAAGAVDHSDATRSFGSALPAAPRLVIRNAIIDGGDLNLGLAFGNNAAVQFENCTFANLMHAGSWRGYTDGWTIRGGQVTSPPVGQWLLDQFANGDGVLIDGLKAAVASVWRAVSCQGGEVRGIINGRFSFDACRGIELSGHWEGDEEVSGLTYPTGAGIIDVSRSVVTVRNALAYASANTAVPFIRINDSAANAEHSSRVTVRDHIGLRYYRSTLVDKPRAADVHIAQMNNGSRLILDNTRGAVVPQGAASHYSDGPVITATQAAITTALSDGFLAAEGGELRYRNAAWECVSPMLRGGRVMRFIPNPSLSQAIAAGAEAGGTLVAGTYDYIMTMRDYKNRYTGKSTIRSVTTTSTGAVRLVGTLQGAPGNVVIWRKAGTGVGSAPDAYCVIPADAGTFRLYDTGTHINGRPWVTTSVPVPDTVAASNATISELLLS
jgi:hypothetical protein